MISVDIQTLTVGALVLTELTRLVCSVIRRHYASSTLVRAGLTAFPVEEDRVRHWGRSMKSHLFQRSRLAGEPEVAEVVLLRRLPQHDFDPWSGDAA